MPLCAVDGYQRVALDGTQFAHQWALDLEAEELPFVAALRCPGCSSAAVMVRRRPST
ncbi:MAG: hypothetical protein ACLTGJ_02315 [Faecalibacterium prausnitzii]